MGRARETIAHPYQSGTVRWGPVRSTPRRGARAGPRWLAMRRHPAFVGQQVRHRSRAPRRRVARGRPACPTPVSTPKQRATPAVRPIARFPPTSPRRPPWRPAASRVWYAERTTMSRAGLAGRPSSAQRPRRRTREAERRDVRRRSVSRSIGRGERDATAGSHGGAEKSVARSVTARASATGSGCVPRAGEGGPIASSGTPASRSEVSVT